MFDAGRDADLWTTLAGPDRPPGARPPRRLLLLFVALIALAVFGSSIVADAEGRRSLRVSAPRTAPAHKTAHLSATLKPARRHVRLVLQDRVRVKARRGTKIRWRTRWVRLSSARTNSRGVARFSFRPATGVKQVTVRVTTVSKPVRRSAVRTIRIVPKPKPAPKPKPGTGAIDPTPNPPLSAPPPVAAPPVASPPVTLPPVTPPPVTPPVIDPAISAGDGYSCALLTGGTVRCWGANDSGQLGDGSVSADQLVPVDVALTGAATSVSAGGDHACATLTDGSIKCWGLNDHGQLGDGSTTSSPEPMTVDLAGAKASAVSAGGSHTCAVLTDGSVECWGLDVSGQLGDGEGADQNRPVPVTLLGSGHAVAISAGTSHTCAVLTDGSVECWGLNDHGQLGDGKTTSSATPVSVSLGGAKAISAGTSHTCAVLTDGSVECWGLDVSGQLGDGGGADQNRPVPVTLLGSGHAVAISAGASHTCAVLTDGSVECWGDNHRGELGNGSRTNSTTPVVAPLATVAIASAVSAGNDHTCALTSTNAVQCWGENADGQLGNGAAPYSTAPTAVAGLVADRVGAGDDHTCALTSGAITCWGPNRYGELGDGTTMDSFVPVPVVPGQTATDIGSGTDYSCALLSDQSVVCWGINTFGELGNGDAALPFSSTPVAVALGASATAISVGAQHACALLVGGSVECWGDDALGQLGDAGTIGHSSTPVPVNLGVGMTATAISAGVNHTCAVLTGGGVECWGYNQYGQLGDGSMADRSETPVAVALPLSATAVAVSAGLDHSCALLSDGSVMCWGGNTRGELGDGGDFDAPSSVPVNVLLAGSATQISSSYTHTCAVVSAGAAVECWGSDSFGQLGDGTTTNRSTPVTVKLGDPQATDVSAGWGHTCAVVTASAVKCWGDNRYGQLGNGTAGFSPTPVGVVGIPG